MNANKKFMRKVVAIFGMALIFIALIFLFWTGRLNSVYAAAININYFIGKPINWVLNKINSATTLISEAPHFLQENKDLQYRNIELENKLIALSDVKKENDQLREQLSVGFINFSQPIFSVKSLGINSSLDLILQGGQEDKLSLNMAVFTAGNILVGKITKILPHQSFAQTIFSPNTQIPVKIMPSNTMGLLQVDSLFNLNVEFKKDSALVIKVSPGDLILTSGIDDLYPPNMIIGKVASVKNSEQELFNEASIQPFWDKETDALFFVQPF